eukprot:9361764-Pyramimonas_sp.AAC.1
MSSTQMRAAGLVDKLEEEQMNSMADRLTQTPRIKSEKERCAALADLVRDDDDMDFDFEADVGQWRAAFQIMCTCASREWGSIEELVDMLEESISVIDESLPTNKKPGSQFGTALATWPSGKAIAQGAKLHLAKAQATKAE